MIDLVLALSLYFAHPRPVNWQAAIGIVQDVRIVTYPTGQQYVSLYFSDGRTVEIGSGVVYGPQAAPDYHAECDQIFSWKESEPW